MTTDKPDPTTGLTGYSKVLTTVGAVGALILMFAYVLYNQLTTIPAAIADLKETNEAQLKAFTDHLDKERERGERNREHGSDHVKAIYQKHREETQKLIERLDRNGDTQKEMAWTLKLILDQAKK